MGIDELEERDTCVLNLANRFQCQTDKAECIPRLYLSDGFNDCKDGSDESLFFSCQSHSSEVGCKWRRGSLDLSTQFQFPHLCDGFVVIKIENITDEDDCPSSWINQCNSSWTRCDGYWHCRDGRDELQCPPVQHYPCKNKEQFYCMNRTTGQFACYSSHLAGDGREDCVGALDERVSGYCHRTNPTTGTKRFRCGNSSICLDQTQLCDGIRDCPIDNNEDEGALCSWLGNRSVPQENSEYFVCPNGYELPFIFRCDGNQDCTNGEDELYCKIGDPLKSINDEEHYLSNIDIYPLPLRIQSVSSERISKDMSSIAPKSRQSRTISNRDLVHATWYCNRGLLAYKNDKEICFCPFYLYGDRCEFQRRRVTITTYLETSDLYSNDFVPLKLVFYLINRENFHIIDYAQHVIIPYQIRMGLFVYDVGRLFIYLLFPIHQDTQSRQATHFVKIDAFILSNQSLDFQASWYYASPFAFLPVQHLAVQLILTNKFIGPIGTCIHGKRMPYVNSEESWCLCELGWTGTECGQRDTICNLNPCSPGSICISVGNKHVCLCTTNRFGSTCRVRTTHICQSNTCQNNGSCLTVDANAQRPNRQYYCACSDGFIGRNCEKDVARFNIQFESELIEKYSHVPVMILRLNYLQDSTQLVDTYRRLMKNIKLEKSLLTFHRDRETHRFDFAFIQLFTNARDIYGQYYLIASNSTSSLKKNVNDLAMHVNTSVLARNHCPYIDQLFDKTIVQLIPLQRAKYYQEPCQKHSQLICFHDENFMCICNRYRITQCFIYVHRLMNCSSSHSCLNDGLCLQQDEIRNPLDYVCICEECFFGDLCQFTTSQYSISLDALLGSIILVDMPFRQQSWLIKTTFIIISILFVIGFCLNTTIVALFIQQKKCRSTGCGSYIMVSSILSTGCLAVLTLKVIALVLKPELNNKMSCIVIEYFLKYLPTMVDWMHTCVFLERVSALHKGASFDKMKSKKIAQVVIISLTVLIGMSIIHDPLHRESITDLRLNEGRRS
ncbi:unnamed protein product, partial [Adineta steineri]